jgi:hypothetical protein
MSAVGGSGNRITSSRPPVLTRGGHTHLQSATMSVREACPNREGTRAAAGVRCGDGGCGSGGLCSPGNRPSQPAARRKTPAVFHPTESLEGLTIKGRPGYKAYFGELNRLGYVEGQNLIVDRYSALGQPDRYETLAREIVASHPNVIFPLSVPMTQRINALTTNIPIVLLTGDPVAYGFTTNLATPSGNVTGVTVDAGFELWGSSLNMDNWRALSRRMNVDG